MMMSKTKAVTRLFLPALLIILLSNGVRAQGTNTDFFQNRIQHRKISWHYFSTENMDVFFHGKNRFNAELALRMAAENIDEIENTIGYRLSGRIHILLFNNPNDFRQSNLLINDPQFNSGGYTYIAQNRLIVYFTGDHAELRRQIRFGLAEVLFKEMIYGGSLQDRISNSTVSFPVWFTQGLFSFLSRGWDAELDNMFRDGILSNKFRNMNDLDEEQQILAGHALWRYISEKYGLSSIANILYVSRVSRSYDNGFPYIIGMDLPELLDEWRRYYEEFYRDDDASRFMPMKAEEIDKRLSLRKHTDLRISPDGKKIAFVTNNKGAYRVWSYDKSRKEKKLLYKAGYKTEAIFTDYSYPLICWTANNELAVVYHKRTGPEISIFSSEGKLKRTISLKAYEKVLSIDAWPGSGKLLLTMVKQGQTDVYLYYRESKEFEALTKDSWDESDARFGSSDSVIIYASNFPADSSSQLYKPYRDIFLKQGLGEARRLTNTPYVDEHLPLQYNEDHISYLGDQNGIVNAFAMPIGEKTKAFPLTNYKRNIILHDLARDAGMISELIFDGNHYQVFFSETENNLAGLSGSIKLEKTKFRKQFDDSMKKIKPLQLPDIKLPPRDSISGEKEKSSYYLQSEYDFLVFDTDTAKASEGAQADNNAPDMSFRYPYTFTPDYVVTQLDNSILNTYYIPTYFDQRAFNTQWLNILAKMSISDLFGDYNISGGLRLPGSLDGSDWFITATDQRRRLDKSLGYFRHARRQENSFGEFNRYSIQEGRFSVKYPFSNRDAMRLGVFGRQDRATILSTDPKSLLEGDIVRNWTGYKLEYIYDNTISLGMNLNSGLRFKLFNEYYKRIGGTENILNIGADLRYYHRIKRNFVWANRLAANSSVAGRKVLYYLGGAENWINPQFNSLPLSNAGKNEYMALVTNLRGFPQNIRNGNSYVVFNSELRFPLFSYFSPNPVRSEFLKHFLLTAFFDAGTAWAGKSPYSANNSYNTKVIETGSSTITVVYQANPFVYGIGGGARGKVFGYYIKYDAAWGILEGQVGKMMHYLSLSMDF